MKKYILNICCVMCCSLIFTGLYAFRQKSIQEEKSEQLFSVSEAYSRITNMYGCFNLLGADVDLQEKYEETFSLVANSSSEFEYYLTMSKFVAALEDGHAYCLPPSDSDFIYQVDMGVSYIENSYVVTRTYDSTVLPLLSKIVKVNGIPVSEYIDENISEYIGVKTPLSRESSCAAALSIGPKGEKRRFTIQTTDGIERDVEIRFSNKIGGQSIRARNLFDMLISNEKIYDSSNFLLYYVKEDLYNCEKVLHLIVKDLSADTAELKDEYISCILPHIKSSNGVIIDLRYCRGGNDANGITILESFFDKEFNYSSNVLYPVKSNFFDSYSQMIETYGEDIVSSDAKDILLPLTQGKFVLPADEILEVFEVEEHFKTPSYNDLLNSIPKTATPAVVLINHLSGSAVDTVADIANEMDLTTIGTHTFGATTNLVTVPLKNEYTIAFSSGIRLTAKGEIIHNNGVPAKIYADYTLNNLSAGIDDYILKAISELNS